MLTPAGCCDLNTDTFQAVCQSCGTLMREQDKHTVVRSVGRVRGEGGEEEGRAVDERKEEKVKQETQIDKEKRSVCEGEMIDGGWMNDI
ncbi:hypothetical protein EYF80_040142 [Liparis tanakae]|uniref:Uncharacterized protein n=1 Tax=Liparis tanakae TaxID=230148 RepID=A0A4Z2G9C5_9TELE|nr:hypothetical protein EYF80_040142 [Liparis tanakae]